MKNCPIRAASLVSSFFILDSAFAETTNSAAASPMASALSTPDIGVSVLRVTGALALVIGIFLAGVWLFRNWQRLAVRGGRQTIYVVGYEQERFLLASSPAGVNFLTHLPAAAGEPEAEEAKPAVSFSNALAQILKGK